MNVDVTYNSRKREDGTVRQMHCDIRLSEEVNKARKPYRKFMPVFEARFRMS